MGCSTYFICIDVVGQGVACGGLPFLGTGCPVPDIANIYLICNFYCLGYCFYNCPPPRMFPPMYFLFEKNGLDYFPWTSFISYLHTIFLIINGVISGLATDSPCGVLGRWWTTCLLSDGAILFLNESRCVCLTSWRRIFYWCLVFIFVFIHYPNVTIPWICLERSLNEFYLYMKPNSFPSKASIVVFFSHHSRIYWFLPEETKCVFPTSWSKTNEYLNSAKQITRNWNVNLVSVLNTS